MLLNTWFERYPAHPLTLDTRARLLLEQVGVFPLPRMRIPPHPHHTPSSYPHPGHQGQATPRAGECVP
jgi:hypothetical protein